MRKLSDVRCVGIPVRLHVVLWFSAVFLGLAGCSSENSAELDPLGEAAVAESLPYPEAIAQSDGDSTLDAGQSKLQTGNLTQQGVSPSSLEPTLVGPSNFVMNPAGADQLKTPDSVSETSLVPSTAAQAEMLGAGSPEIASSNEPKRLENLEAHQMPRRPMKSNQVPAFENLPAGSVVDADEKYATVKVYYATDRAPSDFPLSSLSVGGKRPVLFVLLGLLGGAFVWTCTNLIRNKHGAGALGGLATASLAITVLAVINAGTVRIEKRGMTYTGERGILKLGVAEVTVPAIHEAGVVEQPSIFRFEFAEDLEKHMVMVSATEYGEDDFYSQLQETLVQSPRRELLVFIHGYNVDFPSAVRRTAQLAVDLPFRGAPVCYSWPSQGKLLGYPVDENNAAWTASHLRDFLVSLAEKSHADSIHLVAHSMGNRALTSALSEISLMQSNDEQRKFSHVVLAAPDVDADYFRKDLAPRVLQTAQRVTLYASSDDKALVVSKQVHGYPRAGESGPGLVLLPGVETIDVSGVDLSLLGHSYYGDNGLILKDLFSMLHLNLPARERPLLVPQQVSGMTFWRLHPSALAGAQELRVR